MQTTNACEWLTGWLIVRRWLIDRQTNWLTGWVTDWSTDKPIDYLTNQQKIRITNNSIQISRVAIDSLCHKKQTFGNLWIENRDKNENLTRSSSVTLVCVMCCTYRCNCIVVQTCSVLVKFEAIFEAQTVPKKTKKRRKHGLNTQRWLTTVRAWNNHVQKKTTPLSVGRLIRRSRTCCGVKLRKKRWRIFCSRWPPLPPRVFGPRE